MHANLTYRKEQVIEGLREGGNGEVAQLLEDYDTMLRYQDQKIERLVKHIDALVDPNEDDLLQLIAKTPC